MSIYQSIYDLLHTYVYGGAVLTSDMSLVCTLLSTIGCVFCVAVPFIIVYKIMLTMMGR